MNDIVINPPRRTPPVIVEAESPAQVVATVARGRPGDIGPPGPGVPVGGNSGQVLAKTSGADYATGWVDVAGGSVAWTDVTGKPTFATVATTGAYGDLSGLPALFSGAYGDLTGIPATFAPSAHGHAQADVTGLVAALAGKAATVHGHAIADVTGLQGALDGKQPLSAALTATTASFTTADETKLDGIAAGAQVNVPTDLSFDASTRLLSSSTGADVTLPWFDTTFPGLVPASGGGTLNFLRADGAWATPPSGGGGPILKGTVSLSVPFGSYFHEQTFTAAGVTSTNVCFASVGAHVDSDENGEEFLDISVLSATPGTDQITIKAGFAYPTAGPVKINWSAQ